MKKKPKSLRRLLSGRTEAAALINQTCREKGLLIFGGICPDCESYREILLGLAFF